MDAEGDVKMETKETTPAPAEKKLNTAGNHGNNQPKESVLVMPTGPAPIISNKHPVMHLHELAQDCVFELVSEDKEADPKNRRRTVYTMVLTVNNEKFQGVGQSKKAAKEEAAKYALLKLFNFLYIPDASIASFVPEGTVIGKKRPGEVKMESDTPVVGKKKKKKGEAPAEPKNPVMRLNELRKGLDYVTESQSGPVHAPVFVMSLIVDGMKYEGCGNSKKKAKIDVATKALNALEPQAVVETMKCSSTTT